MSDDRNQVPVTCGKKASFLFESYSSNIQAQKYLWKCSSSDSNAETSDSPTKECLYEEGSYIPALTIVDQNNKEHRCITNVDVKVSTENKCAIKIKDAENLRIAEVNLKIGRGKTIEARIEGDCINEGLVEWTIPGASNLKSEGKKAFWNYPGSGNYEIRASLKIGDEKVE